MRWHALADAGQRGSASQPRPEQDAGQSQDSAEWKRLLRQRLLEDSIVLAEQQGRL